MGDALRNLVKTAAEGSGTEDKVAEEYIAAGQLMGHGFLSVVMDKEGAPAWAGKAGKAISKGGKKLVKGVRSGARKADQAVQKGGNLVAKGYNKTIGKAAKGKASVDRRLSKTRRGFGYGAAAVGTAGVAGGAAAMKKKAQEEPQVKTASDYILRFDDGSED